MDLAERILQAGLDAPDRLAMSLVGLSRADRWSHARLRDAVMTGATPAAIGDRRRDECATPDEVIAWLATGPTFDALPPTGMPTLSPQDRIMLPCGSAPRFLPLALAAWSRGAAIIVPNDKITAAQWPLLGARHGATIIAAPSAHLQAMLGQDWKPWSGLRLGLATDDVPETTRALWDARTGTPLTGLAPHPQTGQ